jgi:hypothetical protein
MSLEGMSQVRGLAADLNTKPIIEPPEGMVKSLEQQKAELKAQNVVHLVEDLNIAGTGTGILGAVELADTERNRQQDEAYQQFFGNDYEDSPESPKSSESADEHVKTSPKAIPTNISQTVNIGEGSSSVVASQSVLKGAVIGSGAKLILGTIRQNINVGKSPIVNTEELTDSEVINNEELKEGQSNKSPETTDLSQEEQASGIVNPETRNIDAVQHVKDVKKLGKEIYVEIEAEEAAARESIQKKFAELKALKDEKEAVFDQTKAYVEKIRSEHPDQFPNDLPQCPPAKVSKTPNAVDSVSRTERVPAKPLTFDEFSKEYAKYLERPDTEYKYKKGKQDFLYIAPKMFYNSRTKDRSFTMVTTFDKVRHIFRDAALKVHKYFESKANYKQDMAGFNNYLESFYNSPDYINQGDQEDVQDDNLSNNIDTPQSPARASIEGQNTTPEKVQEPLSLDQQKEKLSALQKDLKSIEVLNDEKTEEFIQRYKDEQDPEIKDQIRKEFNEFTKSAKEQEDGLQLKIDEQIKLIANLEKAEVDRAQAIKAEALDSSEDQEDAEKDEPKKEVIENKYGSLKEAMQAQDQFINDKLELIINEDNLDELNKVYSRMNSPEGADDYPQYYESETEFLKRVESDSKIVKSKDQPSTNQFVNSDISNNSVTESSPNGLKYLQIQRALKQKIDDLSKPFDITNFKGKDGLLFRPNSQIEIFAGQDGKVTIKKLGSDNEEYQAVYNYDSQNDKYTFTSDGRNNITIFNAKKRLITKKYENPFEI